MWRLALLNDRWDETLADEAADVRRYCDEQGFPAMSGGATAFLGLALNDLDVILEGTGALASTGTLLMAPSACMWVADSYLAQGLYDDALAMIDAGLDLGVSTRQHYYDSPLHRVKAEIILADDRQSEDARGKAAEDEFRQAVEIARAQESKWFELRHGRPGAAVAQAAATKRGAGLPELHLLVIHRRFRHSRPTRRARPACRDWHVTM